MPVHLEHEPPASAPWREAPRAPGLRTVWLAARLWLLSGAFWGAAVLLMTTRKYVARVIVWPPAYFGRMLQGLAPDYLAYALLTPLACLAATRLPVLGRGARTRRNLWMHAGLGLLFSLAASAVTAGVDDALYPTAPGVPPPAWAVRTGFVFATHFCDDLVVYAALVLTTLAVSYYRAYRQQELRAALLEARLSRAQLEALRSQIQPHFLFNTLHSISSLMGSDVAGARKMIVDLKALLQLSMERSAEQVVPLSAELAFLEQYVSIQRTRFRDRLTLEYAVQPGVRRAMVPRLLLQPLVENAIRHGLAPRSAPGRIKVRAEHAAGVLRLSVCDDGVGADGPDGRPTREGIGLGNTRARLRSLYGDAHLLEAANGPDGGFRVEVRIPLTWRATAAPLPSAPMPGTGDGARTAVDSPAIAPRVLHPGGMP